MHSAGSKKTLILGASANPQRYSYMAIHRLREAGHPVVAIGKSTAVVGDVLIDTKPQPYAGVHTVTLYLNPTHQEEYYYYILSLHPQRIIFNPGAENEKLMQLAENSGIETLDACTLVLLSTGQY